MDSKEIRFRLEQVEVGVLLNQGFLREEILLPNSRFYFQVEFNKQQQTQIAQKDNEVIFYLSSAVQEKLKTLLQDTSPLQDKGSLETVSEVINGREICFKLEVDIFNSKQRSKRI
jgi:hypothetical protein